MSQATTARSDVQPVDNQPADNRQRVPVAGGVLVYEPQKVGKELVGFEDVEDWKELADALRARGLGVGAIHHKPVLDNSG